MAHDVVSSIYDDGFLLFFLLKDLKIGKKDSYCTITSIYRHNQDIKNHHIFEFEADMIRKHSNEMQHKYCLSSMP